MLNRITGGENGEQDCLHRIWPLALLYGVVALISPGVLEHEAAEAFRFGHFMREQGAAGIFIGLMAIWCAVNYERRRSVHYFLKLFAFLLAAIHWLISGHLSWLSPVYNSVPFTILLIMAVLSRGRLT